MSTLRVTDIFGQSGTDLPDNLQPITATAWVNFNGTGTVAINDSFNVTSITDNGTGDYTVNFTTALANANYASLLGTNGGSVGIDINIKAASAGSAPTLKTTTQLTIEVQATDAGTATDTADVSVLILGGV